MEKNDNTDEIFLFRRMKKENQSVIQEKKELYSDHKDAKQEMDYGDNSDMETDDPVSDEIRGHIVKRDIPESEFGSIGKAEENRLKNLSDLYKQEEPIIKENNRKKIYTKTEKNVEKDKGKIETEKKAIISKKYITIGIICISILLLTAILNAGKLGNPFSLNRHMTFDGDSKEEVNKSQVKEVMDLSAFNIQENVAFQWTNMMEDVGPNSPFGNLDMCAGGTGAIYLRGWVADWDSPKSALDVHIYVGDKAGSGAPGYAITANKPRTDVEKVYPGIGNSHGFEDVIQVTPKGKQTLYIYAIDVGEGNNVLMGTAVVTIE